MKKRFNLLPTYHFEENTDGKIRGAADCLLRDCTIYGNCGKNLIPYPFRTATTTKNGITFTDNGDGSITVNGTATDYAVFNVAYDDTGIVRSGTYFLSGCPNGNFNGKISLQPKVDGEWNSKYYDTGNGKTVTVQSFITSISIQINPNAVCDNLVFKPQLELGETATDFEPYKEVGDMSRNLLPYPFENTTKTVNGITFTDNGDGSITVSGTPTDYTDFGLVRLLPCKPNQKYTITKNGIGVRNISFVFCDVNKDKVITHETVSTAGESTFTVTTLESTAYIRLVMKRQNNEMKCTGTVKPMLELGETATDYEPYGKYILPVTVSGKNLISYPYSMATITRNGITFTDNGDGTVTANGTATAATSFVCKYYNAKTPIVPDKKIYYLSGCPEGGRTSASVWNYRINAMTYKGDSYVGGYSDWGEGITVDLRNVDFDTLQVQIIINNGATVDNLVFKPQLELGETATDYEPYTAPKTTNLLLDAPLGPGESISCRENGLSVPELATVDSNITNYITFGSEVKPSGVTCEYYKY